MLINSWTGGPAGAGANDVIRATWLLGVSGVRPGAEVGRRREDIERCVPMLMSAVSELRAAAQERGFNFEIVGSLAAGIDIQIARIARDVGIPFHAILPLPEDDFRLDFECEEDVTAFNDLLEHAKRHPDWTVRAIRRFLPRPACYEAVNLDMLHLADGFMLVTEEHFDGVVKTGGTRSLHELCQAAQDVRVVGHLISGDVPAWRDRAPLADVFRVEGDFRRLVSPDGVEATGLPRELEGPAFECFGWQSVSSRGTSAKNEARGSGYLQVEFQKLDGLATRRGQTFRSSLLVAIWLHFVATVIAALAATLAQDLSASMPFALKLASLLELVLVGLASVMILRIERSQTNAQWRASRMAAELAVSIGAMAPYRDPLDRTFAWLDPGFRQLALSLSLLAHRRQSKYGVVAPLEYYLDARLKDQIDYYGKQGKKASREFVRWTALMKTSSLLSVVFVSLALGLKLALESGEVNWFESLWIYFAPVFVPLLATLAATHMLSGDVARRHVRYVAIREDLQRLKQWLPNISTPELVGSAIVDNEVVLMEELNEWYRAAEALEHMA